MDESYEYQEVTETALANIDTHLIDAEGNIATLLINEIEGMLEGKVVRKKPGTRHFVLGGSSMKGGIWESPITVVGGFTSSDALVVPRLSVTGGSTFKELLAVKESTSIQGGVTINAPAIFAGKATLNGGIVLKHEVISSGELQMKGKIKHAKTLFSDGEIKLLGAYTGESIRSVGSVIVEDKLTLNGDIQANSFVFRRGGGSIQGSIHARLIMIGEKSLLKEHGIHDLDDTYTRGIVNIPRLPQYLFEVFYGIIKRKNFKDQPLEIFGDVIGDKISVDNVIIHGNLIGNAIAISDRTVIHGEIQYHEHIFLPKGREDEISTRYLPEKIVQNDDESQST